MRLQTDDRQKNTKGVREGMSEHNTEEPEMIVIDIEEIKNKLLEAGRSLIEDDENENSFADVERFLDPYDDDIDSRTEMQRAEDERKDFDSRFPRCEELVKVYNNRVESLEKKQKLQDQKLVKWLVPLTVLIIFGFQIYLEKYGTGNMEKDLIVSFFWIPVVAFLALVFVFLGSDSEKKEQTDYKWLMEKIFPIIYEKYIRKKLPSIELVSLSVILRSTSSSQPRCMSSSAFSTGLRRAVSPPAIRPIIKVGGMPNVGGISEASSTPRRPLVPAPI